MIKPINIDDAPVLKMKAVQCIPMELNPLSDLMAPKGTLQYWPEDVRETVQDLLDTAASLGEDCFGLAANQIWDKPGPPPAIFIAQIVKPDSAEQYKYGEFINPYLKTSGFKVKLKEKCYSRPGKLANTKREINATITFQTLGNVVPVTLKFYGKDTFLPFILQHEYDHIMGKLI
jgi:peptide deformylase